MKRPRSGGHGRQLLLIALVLFAAASARAAEPADACLRLTAPGPPHYEFKESGDPPVVTLDLTYVNRCARPVTCSMTLTSQTRRRSDEGGEDTPQIYRDVKVSLHLDPWQEGRIQKALPYLSTQERMPSVAYADPPFIDMDHLRCSFTGPAPAQEAPVDLCGALVPLFTAARTRFAGLQGPVVERDSDTQEPTDYLSRVMLPGALNCTISTQMSSSAKLTCEFFHGSEQAAAAARWDALKKDAARCLAPPRWQSAERQQERRRMTMLFSAAVGGDPRLEVEVGWRQGYIHRVRVEIIARVPAPPVKRPTFVPPPPAITATMPGNFPPEAREADRLLRESMPLEPSKALPLRRRALTLFQGSLGPQHPLTVSTAGILASTLVVTGRAAEAVPLLETVLAFERQRAPRSANVGQMLLMLGEQLRMTGDLTRAEAVLTEGLAIAGSGAAAPDLLVAATVAMASLRSTQGRPTEAETLLLKAQQDLPRVGKQWLPALSTAVSSGLCTSLVAQHDVVRARPACQAAAANLEKAGAHNSPELAEVHVNQASLTSNRADAADMLEEALETLRTTYGPRHTKVAWVLVTLGVTRAALGDSDKALAACTEADTILAQGGGPPVLAALPLSCLGAIYLQKKDAARAEEELSKAVTPLRKFESPGALSPLLLSLADIQILRGRSAEARASLGEALGSVEASLRAVWTESRMGVVLNNTRGLTDDLLSLAAAHPEDREAARLTLSAVLLRKGRSTDEGRRLQRLFGDPVGRAQLDRLRTLRAELGLLYLADPAEIPDYQEALRSRTTALDELEIRLAPATRPPALPPADQVVRAVAEALPRDAALVEFAAYWPHDPGVTTPANAMRYAALLLLPDRSIRVVPLGDSLPIDQAVTELLLAFSQQRSDYLPAARRLHDLVFAPLLPVLAGRTRLYLSPDDQLSQVPFAALHDGQRFLIERYQLTYLTSGRDLLRPRQGAPRPLTAAIFAPEFAPAAAATPPSPYRLLDELRGLSRLSGAAREAQDLLKLVSDARLLSGPQASEAALRSLVPPVLLHLGTHGVFFGDPRTGAGREPPRGALPLLTGIALPAPAPSHVSMLNPLARSALLLSGATALGTQGGARLEDGLNDGLVTAMEVASLYLVGTQLVVLSACKSGRGGVAVGEGLYGLPRALFQAGAETVLATLWSVSDSATADLMGVYYHYLITERMGRAEALRRAALELRGTHPHPYFWAPFIALGNDEPLNLAATARPAPAADPDRRSR